MNNGQEWVERLDGIFKISSPGNRYMAPPPPTKLRTTKHMAAHNCAQLSTIADCFHGSRRFIFTDSCSATHGLLLS